MPKRTMRLDPELAAEAKSIVALAFCDGPIEDSHVTQAEMKNIMKKAVDTIYKLLWLKQNDPDKYDATLVPTLWSSALMGS